MYTIALAWAFLGVSTVALRSSQQYQNQQLLHVSYDGPTKSKTTIPGDSPFDFCHESDPQNDLFQIEWIAITPTPPSMYVPKINAPISYFYAPF